MKIALVSPYDFSYPGGVNNHITALEKQLTRMGHQVKVIAPASKAVEAFGDRFLTIGTPWPMPISGTTVRISISLRLASKIKEVLKREKFDIIHLHEPFMVMLCSAMLRFSKSLNIGTFHATKGKPGYNWGWPISRLMLKRRCRKLAGKIAVSQSAMDYASSYVSGPYEIIPNGIDLEKFSPEVQKIKKFNDDKLNILFVGRLEKRKGLKYLLDAYRRVKDEFYNSRLIVVGPGTRFLGKYKKQVRDYGLKDVHFVGSVSDNELPRYYNTVDVFCAPATGQESFGIVLLEAMACGKPIIASNIEGYAGVMTDGKEGILVPPKNVEGLAEALKTIMTDEELRKKMGERGMITAESYSWQRVAKKIAAYYDKVLDESSPKGVLECETEPAMV
jgi:phosphatidylinositol alpha-mannosyltransferase